MNKIRLFAIVTWLFLAVSYQYAQETIYLYKNVQEPNVNGIEVKDSLARERYFKIGAPRIVAYRTSKDENKGAAVLIIPGGGYSHLTYESSGIQIAKWYNTMGVTAFVLYHRLPHSPNLVNRSIAPLQDAQRAIRMIRSKAEYFGIDEKRVGVMGFSAGGHLASTLGTHPKAENNLNDPIEQYSCFPNFMVLVSPVISMTGIGHRGSTENLLGKSPDKELIWNYSNENRVIKNTPPTLLIHANNDKTVSPLNSIKFYQALQKLGINASLHIFSLGGHGIGLRNNPGNTNMWTSICESWLLESGFLTDQK